MVYQPHSQTTPMAECPELNKYSDFEVVEDQSQEPALRYFVHHSSQSAGTIIFFHGNAGSACDRLKRIRDFSADIQRRYNIVFPEYPGYAGDKTEKSEATLTANALAVFDAFQNVGPITVIGRSLGSTIANYVASKRPVKRLALISPPTSIVAVAGHLIPGLKPLLKTILVNHTYDAYLWAKTVDIAPLIIQGDEDKVVPIDMAEELAGQFPLGYKLVNIKGVGHNDILQHKEYKSSLNSMFRQPSAQP